MATQLNSIEVEERLVAALKKRDGKATAADIATDTGLPLGDVEIELRRMLALYKSHLDVDDDGLLRYRFDPALERRGESVERALYKARKVLWSGFKWFFKAWIMITLVGYTITFIVLLVALAVGAMAASSNSDSDSDGLVRLPIHLLGRFLEYMFWFNIIDGNQSRGRSRGRSQGRSRRKSQKPEKPFYQKVFDFVFGPDAIVDPLAAQRTFAAFVRHNKGRLTPADWASRSGQTLEQAENALTAGIMRFGGEVDVTDDGNLSYRFDELRASARSSGDFGHDIDPIWQKRATVRPMTGNPTSTNGWIIAFNAFNLAMSTFVLVGLSSPAQVSLGVTIGLGWVPLIFSLMFFSIPIFRWIGQASAKSKAEKENERRQAYQAVYSAARKGLPVMLDSKISTEIAMALDGEPDLEGGGDLFTFETLTSQMRDASAARANEADQVVFGQTVFSSDEAEKSMEETDLEEFERRLAFELGAPETQRVAAAAPVHVLN